jgi:hypothetical protein
MASEVATITAEAETPVAGSAIGFAKSKRKNKSLAARGPGALNKKCGTGFEGISCELLVMWWLRG